MPECPRDSRWPTLNPDPSGDALEVWRNMQMKRSRVLHFQRFSARMHEDAEELQMHEGLHFKTCEMDGR